MISHADNSKYGEVKLISIKYLNYQFDLYLRVD